MAGIAGIIAIKFEADSDGIGECRGEFSLLAWSPSRRRSAFTGG
jgi:hypothetical protein